VKRIIFACVHSAGRSQMAAALFNSMARGARAVSAGTEPAGQVHAEVVQVMREVGIDLSAARPQRLTADMRADVLVTMGCGEKCPFIPGARVIDWPLPDPKGLPLERVREIRDEIAARVRALSAELDGI